MLKFLLIFREQTPKKIKKIVVQKPNSRWLPKLNLLVKRTNHLCSKKFFFESVLVVSITKFYRTKSC
jgi:hypothetical protein